MNLGDNIYCITVRAWTDGNLNEEVSAGKAINFDKIALLTQTFIHDTDVSEQKGFANTNNNDSTSRSSSTENVMCSRLIYYIISVYAFVYYLS